MKRMHSTVAAFLVLVGGAGVWASTEVMAAPAPPVGVVRMDAPGDTYDASSLQAVGDGARKVVIRDNPRQLGGIKLSVVGKNVIAFKAPNPLLDAARGYPPLRYSTGGVDCDDPDDYLCEPILPFDTCSQSFPAFAKAPPGIPRKNGVWRKVAWTAVGCVNGVAEREFLLASGVTTYKVSGLRRVVRPAVSRTIWDSNFDDYINICINDSLDIRASGGRLYCVEQVRSRTVTARFTLRQTTRFTNVPPAYVCPGGLNYAGEPLCRPPY